MAPWILVVEDERELAELYASWLGEYEVAVAHSGRGALEQADAAGAAVDVVVLDRELPGMSGEEVLAALRERGHDPGVAVASASAPDADAAGGWYDTYLRKPISREQLTGAVEELLRSG
jgi:CheY-like chemotaxis protein